MIDEQFEYLSCRLFVAVFGFLVFRQMFLAEESLKYKDYEKAKVQIYIVFVILAIYAISIFIANDLAIESPILVAIGTYSIIYLFSERKRTR